MWSILPVPSLHHAAKHHGSSTANMLFTQGSVTQDAHNKHTGPVATPAVLFAAISTLAAVTYQGCFPFLPPFQHCTAGSRMVAARPAKLMLSCAIKDHCRAALYLDFITAASLKSYVQGLL